MSLSRRIVDDVETLKAVTHPLRLHLLGLLRTDGPATASELARTVGESSGSTSYHLRQLERFGFIDDNTEQHSGRERRWRAVHDLTSFPDRLATQPGGRAMLDRLSEYQLKLLADGVQAWRSSDDPEAFGHSDYVLNLDPDDLRELTNEITSLIERYQQRPGSRSTIVHVLALPHSS